MNITKNNCQQVISSMLCSLPCGWKDAISNAICNAISSGGIGQSGYSGYSGPAGAGIDGTSGYSGYSGFSGINGESAFSGISGYSGYSGGIGNDGLSGYSGYSGSNPGLSGYSGFSGSNPGVSGYSGYSGANPGQSGYSGYSGYSGAPGTSGFSGTSTTITADNALIMSTPTNVEFGGPVGFPAPLIHDSYVSSVNFSIDIAATSLFKSLLKLETNATDASGNTQKLIELSLSGANSNSSQTTYGLYSSNTHTGTLSTNIAGYFFSSSAANNYAIIVPAGGGQVGIGTSTPNSGFLTDIEETTRFGALLTQVTRNVNSAATGGTSVDGRFIITGGTTVSDVPTLIVGLYGELAFSNSGNWSYTGGGFYPTISGVNGVVSMFNGSGNLSGGSIPLSGGTYQLNVAGAGNVDSFASVRAMFAVQTPAQSLYTGTITNYYGVYIDDHNNGSYHAQITNKYGVYQQGTSETNVFNGKMSTPNLQNFANDGAAATGGIAIGQQYRNGSVVMVRVT